MAAPPPEPGERAARTKESHPAASTRREPEPRGSLRWGPLLVGCALCASVVATGTDAAAQPEAKEQPERGWIRQWADFRDDLNGLDWTVQLRAIERLGASSQPHSRRALVDVVGNLSGASGSAPNVEDSLARRRSVPGPSDHHAEAQGRLRLALARALARHAAHPDASQALLRMMSVASDGGTPYDSWALHTAAFALARSGQPAAIQTLGRHLSQSPALASAAREALLTHPPSNIEPLLELPPTEPLIEVLGELGNPRAFDFLRGIVLRGTASRSSLAAWSLFRLGFPETRELAHHWLEHGSDDAQRLVAVRILWPTHDPRALQVTTSLLQAAPDDLVLDARLLEAIAEKPHPQLEASLLRLARGSLRGASNDATPTEREAAVLLALARLDTKAAAATLVDALDGPFALPVAEALARTDGAHTGERLAAALGEARRRAWALRILGVRLGRGAARAQRAAFDGAAQALVRTAPSARSGESIATARAAAAWALAVATPGRAAELLRSEDEVVARAAARQAFRGPLAAAAARLLSASESRQRASTVRNAALLHACLDPAATRGIPTDHLEWFRTDAGRAAPPVLAGIIARTRQPLGLLPTDAYDMALQDVRTWLGSGDAAVQAAAAHGLARAATPAAVALLADILRWNDEPVVRRAAALALHLRSEAAARSELSWAAHFDPDVLVRELAESIPHTRSSSPGVDAPLFWQRTDQPVQLLSAWGESLFLHPDPDGFAGVFGFGPQPWEALPVTEDDPAVANPTERGEASIDP